MTALSDAEIYQEIGKIISQFDILQCYQCATTLMNWLAQNGIEGKVIKLSTYYKDEDYIVSDRLGSDESITINGKHYGVEVRGLVFDNLSTQGMTLENWLNDFHCPSELFDIEELGDL